MLVIFLPEKVNGDPFQQSSLENEEVARLAQYLEHTHVNKSVAHEISFQYLTATSSSDVNSGAPSRESPVYRLPIDASDSKAGDMHRWDTMFEVDTATVTRK